MNAILEAALGYAARGWPIFPIVPRDKVPATEHGFKDASTDTAQIEAWFAAHPEMNVGVRTGQDADIFVLDVDPKHEGHATLAALVAKHGPLPKTVVSHTGTGGAHQYFRRGKHKIGNKNGFLPGLDIRGEGGYVVAPPSTHPNGEPYRWDEGCAPGEVEIADAPEWLIEIVVEKPKPKAAPKQRASADDQLRRRADGYIGGVPNVSEGQRNDAAFRLAGQLRALVGHGGEVLNEDEILERVRIWNVRNSPPLDDRELQQCVASSAKNGTPLSPKPPREAHVKASADGVAHENRDVLVVWKGDLHKTADECIRRLAQEGPPVVFQWGRGLVVITHPCDGQSPSDHRRPACIHRLTDVGLCDILSQRILFQRESLDRRTNEKKLVPIDCPIQVARVILARGAWLGIAPLTGVLEAPSMLADGSVVSQPGYDKRSGLYFDFERGGFPAFPANPTHADAERALREVVAPIFAEFPFASPASRSVLYSGLLTSVTRIAYSTAPLHGFTAPSMASGKTLLCDVITTTLHGRALAAIAQADKEEETEKRIHSALLAGGRAVVIDNVQRPLGGETICTAITGTAVGIRRFGTQEIVKVATWNTLFLASGNNLEFDKDMRSRALMCRLDPHTEHPEQRTFKIARLLEYVAQNRSAIIAALLSIARAYHVAGRPDQGLRPLNRFEGWSDLVRSALVWLGEADPVLTMDTISRSDGETQGLVALLHAFRPIFGDKEFTAAEAIKEAQEGTLLYEALDGICANRSGGGLNAKRLGRFLERSQDRVVDQLRIELSSNYQGTNRYRVLLVVDGGSRGSGGNGGDDSPHTRACARTHEERDDIGYALGRDNPTYPTSPTETSAERSGLSVPPAGWTSELIADAVAREAEANAEPADADADVWKTTFDNKPVWN